MYFSFVLFHPLESVRTVCYLQENLLGVLIGVGHRFPRQKSFQYTRTWQLRMGKNWEQYRSLSRERKTGCSTRIWSVLWALEKRTSRGHSRMFAKYRTDDESGAFDLEERKKEVGSWPNCFQK